MADRRILALWLAALAVLAAALFSLWPGIDLAVTRLAYSPGQGFPVERAPLARALREVFWSFSDAMIALAAIGLVFASLRRPLWNLPWRDWLFVILLYVLGPGLVVNGILKNYWGRARPADVTQFGGDHAFSPALWISDQCERNCSFVSGEGAASIAFAVSAVLILWRLKPRLPPAIYRLGQVLALTVGLAGSALRVMAGRHFLSDTVFAALIVLALALALSRILRVPGGLGVTKP